MAAVEKQTGSKIRTLPVLYEELASLTFNKCGECALKQCCEPVYCEASLAYAEDIGYNLSRTSHPTLPLMSDNGCIAPAWVRPLCSQFICEDKKQDPNFLLNYNQLRQAIYEIEGNIKSIFYFIFEKLHNRKRKR